MDITANDDNYIIPDGSEGLSSSFAGTTTNNKEQDYIVNNKPGKRLQNPLGNYASYTYQLSLYMVTPEALNTFIENDRKFLPLSKSIDEGGAFIIAQSGGVNNETSSRPPGFLFNYYIDDLKTIQTVGGEDHPATITYDYTFNIYEPYGFSFITNLQRAFNYLKNKSSTKNYGSNDNALPARNFFILGIKFICQDENGNTYVGGKDGLEIPDKYYEIFITDIKFKLDGKTTVYNIKATNAATTVGFGTKHGIVDNTTTIVGKTVEEQLNNLMETLNNRQYIFSTQKNNDDKTTLEVPIIYTVEFIDNESQKIAQSSLLSDSDLNKLTYPMSNSVKVDEVNDRNSILSSPDFNKKIFTINGSTPIAKSIIDIIMRSEYIGNTLKTSLKSVNQPNTTNNTREEKINNEPIPFKFFKITPEIDVIGFDTITNDYSYHVKYLITTCEVPYMPNGNIIKSTPYYGPFKRYDYLLTGKNSEVIRFEQQINNTYYFNGVLENDTNIKLPQHSNKKTGQGNEGKLDNSFSVQGSLINSLYDPSWVNSKITILGDPDFLMQPPSSKYLRTYGNGYYGSDGYTINPTSGQVFIEINFNEGIDYNFDKNSLTPNEDGLFSINDLLKFYDFKTTVPDNVKGLSYLVLKSESTFRRGLFTQDLTLVLNYFPLLNNPKEPNYTNIINDTNPREVEKTKNNVRTNPNIQSQNNIKFNDYILNNIVDVKVDDPTFKIQSRRLDPDTTQSVVIPQSREPVVDNNQGPLLTSPSIVGGISGGNNGELSVGRQQIIITGRRERR